MKMKDKKKPWGHWFELVFNDEVIYRSRIEANAIRLFNRIKVLPEFAGIKYSEFWTPGGRGPRDILCHKKLKKFDY